MKYARSRALSRRELQSGALVTQTIRRKTVSKELFCPRTGAPLRRVPLGEVDLYISEGCGGVWLSKHALEHVKFDDPEAAEELTTLLERYHREPEDPEARLRSPEAPDVVMMRRYYSPKRKVEIDECAATGGIWLDPGDLAELRARYPTREERERVGEDFIEEVLGSPEVPEAFARSDEEVHAPRLERVRSLLSRLFGRGF